MVVAIIVFVGCFGFGSAAAARSLPDLGGGRVAGLAFFAVCGLLGGALALVGLHIYSIVNELTRRSIYGPLASEALAGELRSMLLDAGTLIGLAGILYLLAPHGRRERIATAARASTLPDTD